MHDGKAVCTQYLGARDEQSVRGGNQSLLKRLPRSTGQSGGVGDVVCRKKDKVVCPYWRETDQPWVSVVLGVGRQCDCEVHNASLFARGV